MRSWNLLLLTMGRRTELGKLLHNLLSPLGFPSGYFVKIIEDWPRRGIWEFGVPRVNSFFLGTTTSFPPRPLWPNTSLGTKNTPLSPLPSWGSSRGPLT